MSEVKMTDTRIERTVSLILRSGVIISGSVVLAGGVFLIAGHGSERLDYRLFRGEPAADRLVGQILTGVARFRARSVIQLGLLLLLATPIARVAFSLVGFALERDRVYVLITAIVLAILLYSLAGGAVGAA